MNAKKFNRLARRALVLYATGANGLERVIDEINTEATDAQWDTLCAWLGDADEDEVDYGVPTLAQLEEVTARREGRENRYPGPLTSTLRTPRQNAATVMYLVQEYRSKGKKVCRSARKRD